MNLKISTKRILKWVGWAVLVIVFLVFFIRVNVFESEYYNGKQGSERAVAETSEDGVEISAEEELVEVEPTEEEIHEYTVAADRPRYLTIEGLGIYNARILEMAVTATGELDTPNNIFDVGWYNGSGKPGMGGTMVIDGHNGGPNVRGVFKDLPKLAIGSIVSVERGDGIIYNYKVVENKEIALSEADNYMKTALVSPEKGKESVTLISCSGEWSQTRGTYLSRQFVRAVIAD